MQKQVVRGNFGLEIAAIGKILGFDVHIFMPGFATRREKQLLKLYGATLHLNYNEPWCIQHCISKLPYKFAQENGAFETLQFENMDNVNSHYGRSWGKEIEQEVGDKVGAFIAGIGSGGTFAGVAKNERTW